MTLQDHVYIFLQQFSWQRGVCYWLILGVAYYVVTLYMDLRTYRAAQDLGMVQKPPRNWRWLVMLVICEIPVALPRICFWFFFALASLRCEDC